MKSVSVRRMRVVELRVAICKLELPLILLNCICMLGIAKK